MLCQFLLFSKENELCLCVYIHICSLLGISFPFRSPQSTEYSPLCYTEVLKQLSILYIVVNIYQPQSPNPFHPSFPPWCHYIYSLHLCLYFCFAKKNIYAILGGLPLRLSSKEPACNAGDMSSIPGSGRSPGGGHDNPLQCSCLEDLTDRGAWQTTVQSVAQKQDRTEATEHACTHIPFFQIPHVSINTQYLLFSF